MKRLKKEFLLRNNTYKSFLIRQLNGRSLKSLHSDLKISFLKIFLFLLFKEYKKLWLRQTLSGIWESVGKFLNGIGSEGRKLQLCTHLGFQVGLNFRIPE